MKHFISMDVLNLSFYRWQNITCPTPLCFLHAFLHALLQLPPLLFQPTPLYFMTTPLTLFHTCVDYSLLVTKCFHMIRIKVIFSFFNRFLFVWEERKQRCNRKRGHFDRNASLFRTEFFSAMATWRKSHDFNRPPEKERSPAWHITVIAPAGISPRGEIPRRHPSSSHVY